jgi:hypothetical protein
MELRKQLGVGEEKYNTDDGLYNDQIDNIMKKFNTYLGTIASDEIPTKIVPKVKPNSQGSFIMNTDPSYKSGLHWVAVYFDARPNGTKSIEYYDSYGDPPTKETLQGLKLISEKLKSPVYLKLKINRVTNQRATSSNCGFFCIMFINDRMRGKSFKEATGYPEQREKIPNVNNGENRVEKFKEEVFGII